MIDVGYIGSLRSKRDAIVATMREAMIEQIPRFASSHPAGKAALDEGLHEAWSSILQRASHGESLTEGDFESQCYHWRQAALNSFPLAELEAGSQIAHTRGLQQCLLAGEEYHPRDVTDFIAWGSQEQPRLIRATRNAYIVALREAGEAGQARQLLLKHLLEGAPASTVADAAGVLLPEGYLVVLSRPKPAEVCAIKMRRDDVERALRGVPGALWTEHSGVGGFLVLLPCDAGNELVVRAVASDIIVDLASIFDQRLIASHAIANGLKNVPEAFCEAREALALVSALPDAQNRPYHTEELLVELAVARQTDLQQRLANLLQPLQQGTDLRQTVEMLFSCEMDRESTSRALHIHRRTLTYRLQRVRELTGIDVSSAYGIQVLRVALTAARISS